MSASDPSVTPVAARASTDNLVEIQDVHYSVNGREIFSGLNLAIPRGRITAIMGPSGTGKTTLMRLITGQIRPLREHTKLPNSLIRHIVLTKLQAVGLRGAAGLEPAELSGGMARRVALARAMATDPELLIYDEPFTGLDPISMGMIVRLVRQMNYALGITSIVVSHDVEELSILADMSYIIAGGKVAAAGSFVDLKDHQSEIVNQFMNGLADGPVAFHYPAPDYFEQLLSRTV